MKLSGGAHILIDPDEEKALLTEIVRQNEMYCSPEKSGRMNHVPDARSDLYALGLILFAGDRRLPYRPQQGEDWGYLYMCRSPSVSSNFRPELAGSFDRIIGSFFIGKQIF